MNSAPDEVNGLLSSPPPFVSIEISTILTNHSRDKSTSHRILFKNGSKSFEWRDDDYGTYVVALSRGKRGWRPLCNPSSAT